MRFLFAAIASHPLFLSEDYLDGPVETWHRKTHPIHVKDQQRLARRAVDHGERSVLIIVARYQDATQTYCDEVCALSTMWADTLSVSSHFNVTSGGLVTMPADLGAVVSIDVPETISDANGCPYLTMMNTVVGGWSALPKTVAFNGSRLSFPLAPSNFDHIVLNVPSPTGSYGCGWSGLAYVNGCNEPTNTYCRAWINTDKTTTLAHELGHTIGLHHAASDPDDDRILGSSASEGLEYGDSGDVMGSSASLVSFGAPHQMALGFVEAETVAFIDNLDACNTNTAEYTISALGAHSSTPTVVTFIRVPTSSEQTSRALLCESIECSCNDVHKSVLGNDLVEIRYYVSFRGGVGHDASLDSSVLNKVVIHSHGVSESEYTVDKTYLVATLGLGNTWRSTTTGATIEVTALSQSSATFQIQFECTGGLHVPFGSNCSFSEPVPTPSPESDSTEIWPILMVVVLIPVLVLLGFAFVPRLHKRNDYTQLK